MVVERFMQDCMNPWYVHKGVRILSADVSCPGIALSDASLLHFICEIRASIAEMNVKLETQDDYRRHPTQTNPC